MARRKKSPAQLDREIAEVTARSALRDLLRRAQKGEEPGAALVAGDAILSAGYSPERASRALSQRPISEEVRQAVRRVEDKRIERREAAVQRAAVRPPPGAARKASEQINNLIHNRYFSSIPLDQIFDIVERAGLHFDPEEKEVILTGREGRATWQLFSAAGRETNHMLVLSWHKMEQTGRYEIVAYVS